MAQYIGSKMEAKGIALGVPTVDTIRTKVQENPEWACKGCVAIFALQTAEEQKSAITTEDNGVGFSGVDAEFLTSLAVQYTQRGSLSPRQLVHLHKRMKKYAGQLWWISYNKAVSALS
jgi:hypothetical protein|tara:strand:+ start:535 stop:888 length:354 start_codon:yes stop_codon:yes gene_type:complete